MKNSILKVLALVMVCILALGAIACGSEAKKEEGTVDWSKYPEKLEDWKFADLKDYLRTAGIIEAHEKCLSMDMSEGDLAAGGADAGMIYMDTEAGSIMDIIMVATADNLLNELRSSHTLAGVPMDALLGNFAFSYSNGYDEEHLAAIKQAINDLAAHYGVTPDFIG